MDSKIHVGSKNIIRFYMSSVLFFIICILLVFSIQTINEARADSPAVALKNVQAEFFTGVDGKRAIYDKRVYNIGDGYAKNCIATFGLASPYYRFYYQLDGSDLQALSGGIMPTPAKGEVSFSADRTGVYTVVCRAYGDLDENAFLGEASVTFKNDVTEPVLPNIESMTEWKKTGTSYSVNVDWSECYDAVSGVYGAYYFYKYKDDSESEIYYVNTHSLINTTTISITSYCILTLFCYDNAGNCAQKEYAFDKFDDVKPETPIYTISPDYIPGKFSNSYTITADFHEKSDDIAQCGYLMNGVTYTYEAPIVLTKPMTYDIKLFAVDEAGNVSDYAVINIPYNAFDISSPNVTSEVYSIDITSTEGICTISFACSDAGESGLSRAYFENSQIEFSRTPYQNYEVCVAKFDCYDFKTDKLRVLDNAGNVYEKQYVFNYFSNNEISELIKSCANEYRKLNKADCTDAFWNDVTNYCDKLNALLSATNSSENEIFTVAQSFHELLNTDIMVLYTIDSLSESLSGILSFKASSDDFPNTKKGTVVSVIMESRKTDTGNYEKKSGFKKSFATSFALKLNYNGEEISEDLANGLSVAMNMPTGYYDRDYKLYNVTTGKEEEVNIANNKINFVTKASSEYVLVISGSKTPASFAEKGDTITVFGNNLKLSTFLWVVCVCGGVALLTVVGLLILKKARG